MTVFVGVETNGWVNSLFIDVHLFGLGYLIFS
jgi:hypothetical protein